MLWFHSSASSNFWKIGKFPIPFPKFLENTFPKIRKTHFKKLENNFGNLLIFQNVEKADE